MAAPSTADLVKILGQSGPSAITKTQLNTILGTPPSQERENFFSAYNTALRSGAEKPSGTFVGADGNTSSPTTPATTPYVTPGATGELNVPYGADFLPSVVQGLLGVLGLEQDRNQFGQTFPESQRQFNETLATQQQQYNAGLLFQAAQALAGLRANPNSAAEAAIMSSNLGLPTGLPSSLGIEQLIRDATLGASTPRTGDVAGTQVSLPGSLTGAQTAGVLGTPAEGVLSSFAKAIGDPNYLANSIRALVPAGFGGVGSGLG